MRKDHMKLRDFEMHRGSPVSFVADAAAGEEAALALWREALAAREARLKKGEAPKYNVEMSGNCVSRVDPTTGAVLMSVTFRAPVLVDTGVTDEKGDPIFRLG